MNDDIVSWEEQAELTQLDLRFGVVIFEFDSDEEEPTVVDLRTLPYLESVEV